MMVFGHPRRRRTNRGPRPQLGVGRFISESLQRLSSVCTPVAGTVDAGTRVTEVGGDEALQLNHWAAQAAYLATFLVAREADSSTTNSAQKFPARPVLLVTERTQQQQCPETQQKLASRASSTHASV